MTNHAKQLFIEKVQQLDKDDLKVLFDKLKAEEAPLGMIMFVGKEYAKKAA